MLIILPQLMLKYILSLADTAPGSQSSFLVITAVHLKLLFSSRNYFLSIELIQQFSVLCCGRLIRKLIIGSQLMEIYICYLDAFGLFWNDRMPDTHCFIVVWTRCAMLFHVVSLIDTFMHTVWLMWVVYLHCDKCDTNNSCAADSSLSCRCNNYWGLPI